MMRLAFVAASALLLTGCAASPQDAGAAMCEDGLQYAIEQGVPISETWVGSELSVEDVDVVARDEDVDAFDVSGTATVTLASGRELTVAWECFTQTVDGETYAEIQSVG